MSLFVITYLSLLVITYCAPVQTGPLLFTHYLNYLPFCWKMHGHLLPNPIPNIGNGAAAQVSSGRERSGRHVCCQKPPYLAHSPTLLSPSWNAPNLPLSTPVVNLPEPAESFGATTMCTAPLTICSSGLAAHNSTPGSTPGF